MNEVFLEKVKAVMLGHAVADALGVPVEFFTRATLDKDPVIDMRGYGTYSMPAGSWSDDTSMALCTLEVLGMLGIDYDTVMQKFGAWYYNNEFTPTGVTFDVGGTCARAIENYFLGQIPAVECGLQSENFNGNGSLMRIHPLVLYLVNQNQSLQEKMENVHTMSALTHAHERSKIGCGIYAFVLWELLNNPTKAALNCGLQKAKDFYKDYEELSHYQRLFKQDFALIKRENIFSTGYVVHTLEAEIWCLLTTESYQEAVLKAVNLGDDTDTVAAVTGGLAGALYGYNSIPKAWCEALLRREYIENLCEILAQ